MPVGLKELEGYREYFSGNRGPERAAYTVKNYIAPFVTWMGEDVVTTNALMGWRQSLIKARTKQGGRGRPAIHRSPSSRNRHIGAVKAFLNWARKMGYVKLSKDAIYDTLEPFPVGKRPPVALTEEQIVALLKASTEREDQPRMRSITRFLVLALFTGARPGEVKSLTWQDVDWEQHTLRITESKNNRIRIIPFDSPLLEKFLRTWHLLDKGEPTAPIADWKGLNTNPERWKPVFAAAGVAEETLKSLRTAAVAFYASAKAGIEAEYIIGARFGHGDEVSKHFYRSPLWQVRGRGPNVEDYYGPRVRAELERVLAREEEKVYE